VTKAPELHALTPDLFLDCSRPALSYQGRTIPLTGAECACLEALIQRAGTTLTRPELVAAARGADSPTGQRAVDVHIAALRSKLGPYARLIETVRGVGYRFRRGENSEKEQ
jgi:two-component system phosphate regulon response regulator PhoB